jgi:hypothetical protein
VDGIGPAVEKRLHSAGILTFAQLASLKPEKLAKLLNGMVGYSPKRIKDEDWSGQARILAEKAGQTLVDEAQGPTNNSLHYASYTVELLLDRENQVRRTRAMHVQSSQEATWAGWDAGRLHDFLVDSGQLQTTSSQESLTVDEAPVSKPAPSPTADLEPSRPALALKGATKIIDTRLVNQSGQSLGAIIPGDQPFEVQLLLDLSQVEVPKGERMGYDATIYLKKLGKSDQVVTGGKEGTLTAVKSAMIDVSSQPVAPGDYRLEALVALRPFSQPKRLKNQLMAMTESMLLHVA